MYADRGVPCAVGPVVCTRDQGTCKFVLVVSCIVSLLTKMCSRTRTSLAMLSLLDQPEMVWSNMASPLWNASMDMNQSIMCDPVSHITGDKFWLSAHLGA